MLIMDNRIIRKNISFMLIVALIFTGLFLYPKTAYADKVILSEEVYHHLDMGVQLAYGPGSFWGKSNIYGSTTPLSVHTDIIFNNEIEVIDTYPLRSSKGSNFDFNANTSSHNIPKSLGSGNSAYQEYYEEYTSTSMTEGSCNSSEKTVFFSYTAILNTPSPLEVVSYGRNGADNAIYQLFGGKATLEREQPSIADAIAVALKAGREGTAGNNKLYLIFCPNVIEYKKYITIGDLEANLSLPSKAKQNESYIAADASSIDGSLTVATAILEKHYGDGAWQPVATWPGRGPGENSGGSIQEKEAEICTVTYRLTVTTTEGQTDTDIKTIKITDGREVDATAILDLPTHTYEGHPTIATDLSEFEVDGTFYSARRAYEEKIATNRFTPLPGGAGTAIKDTLTTAYVTFPRRGQYSVRLDVDTADGKRLSDTKPIEVLRTPYIIDNLGGIQKQNRKQTLNISVATSPDQPVTDYYIQLKDMKSGQVITLTKDQRQANNATIKTRAHMTGGNEYWTEFTVEFLTKTPSYNSENPDYTQDFQYTVYVKDQKGDTDSVQKNFAVKPDLPPNAQITIQDSFIRNKGTNTAEITAEDSSTTDGDQLERTWSSGGADLKTLPGYRDLSFGSGQKVQYDKTGVGKAAVQLSVKDIWIEPTLEEYITPEDYLSAATEATTDVINIAPTVRLEPVSMETADVTIVTSKASESAITAGMNSLRAALLEAGIDANLQVIPTAMPNDEGYRPVGNYTWKVALNDPSQKAGLIFDSEYAYAVEAAGFTMSYHEEIAIPPYTVKALKQGDKAEDGIAIAWSYTVTESANFGLYLDSLEKYVYLACKDKGETVLLNRKNGAYVTTLPVLLPGNPYTTERNNNLYFLSEDKIEKYDPDARTLKTVIGRGGTLGRLQNGKITFVGREDGDRFYIGQFDMSTETITQKSIPGLEGFSAYPKGWSITPVIPTDLDPAGKVTFTQTIKDASNYTKGIVLWLADAENQRTYNLGQVASPYRMQANSAGFVTDERGKAVYMYHAYSDENSSTSTRRFFHAYIYTLGEDGTPPMKRTIYSKDNGQRNWNGISYAKYHSREDAIYLMQGAAFQGPDWGGIVHGVQCRIQLPSWDVSLSGGNWDWDFAEEEGRSNDFMMMTYYNYDNWTNSAKRIKMFRNAITKEQAEESALTRFADYTKNTTRYIEKNFNGKIQELADKVKEAVKEKTSLKLRAGQGGLLSLSKTLDLKPGQTYYYEYEMKKPAEEGENPDGEEEPEKLMAAMPEISFETENIYPGAVDLGSFYVDRMHEEGFNDSKFDPFFTYVEGIVNGRLITPQQEKGKYNANYLSTATVKFTIPGGKRAAIVMDVAGNHRDPGGSGWKSGVYINGKRYDKDLNTGFDLPGYMHPYLLGPGEKTIQLRCYWYGLGNEGHYISMDNLKVMILSETPDASAKDFETSLTKDGWTKVAGSFKAPQEIPQFKAQAMDHGDLPPEYTSSASGNNGYHDFVIPTGKIGKIHGGFSGYSGVSDQTAGTFTIRGWSISHQGSASSYNGGIHHYVTNGEYYIGAFQGSNRFSTRKNYQSGVGFSKLEAYVYPDNLKDSSSFFFSDDKVYAAAEHFGGVTTVKLNLAPLAPHQELLLQDLKIYYIHNGNKVYLYDKPLQETKELTGWTLSEETALDMHRERKSEKEAEVPLVYKKGELVAYNIFYDDYEEDPSKAQFWRYTHTPYNDGPHPDAAVILDEDGNVMSTSDTVLSSSVPRFYIDGKYTVEHWQMDNTNRTGDILGTTDYTEYDKPSNVESITFYIEGGANAPWITSIKTIPGMVKEGEQYRLQIGVDDVEKDELRLTTELYYEKKLLYTHRENGIVADLKGNYPLITTGYPPPAAGGAYEVVCTVRDDTGAGLGTYRFTVTTEGKITGYVHHTDQWDTNRKRYNLKRFDDEINRAIPFKEYLSLSAPRMRGTNVFWSGEKFLLEAVTEGTPKEVKVKILEESLSGNRHETGYHTRLSQTGKKKDGGELWTGALWQSTMINRWGRKTPQKVVAIFEAVYEGNKIKTHEEEVIVDSNRDYWQLHRLW